MSARKGKRTTTGEVGGPSGRQIRVESNDSSEKDPNSVAPGRSQPMGNPHGSYPVTAAGVKEGGRVGDAKGREGIRGRKMETGRRDLLKGEGMTWTESDGSGRIGRKRGREEKENKGREDKRLRERRPSGSSISMIEVEGAMGAGKDRSGASLLLSEEEDEFFLSSTPAGMRREGEEEEGQDTNLAFVGDALKDFV